MHRFLVSTLIATGIAAASLSVANAQNVEEIHHKALQEWLAQNPSKMSPMKLPPDLPLAIPADAKTDLRFEFQFRMALAGHGALFDIEGNRVKLDPDEMQALQKEMLEAVQKDAEENLDIPFKELAQLQDLGKELEEIAFGSGLPPEQSFIVQNLLLRTFAYRMTPILREGYIWRADYLRQRWEVLHKFDRIDVIEFADKRFLEWYRRFSDVVLFPTTDYMRDCAAAGVPVPPNFALNGTAWAKQGSLTVNMLIPGDSADLYTWAAPHDRGACVALPRTDADGVPNLAGIICQSAITGSACIWDSIFATGGRVPWESQTMIISSLKDGRSLSGCNGCHEGNNAFLIAPDDPAWCRLLRGNANDPNCLPITGANTHNFTTNLERSIRPVSAGNGTMHSRFRFLTGTPARGGWENNITGSCGACHLVNQTGYGFVNGGNMNSSPPRQPMQPGCGFACNTP